MNKTAIKNFAVWARNKLIADISYKAGLLGITDKEIKPALPQSTKDAQFFDIGSREPYQITGAAIAQRKALADKLSERAKQSDYITAYKAVVEEVAYTWFNRLIAVRFMEVNDYLPSRIRVLSGTGGKTEPDIVTTPFDTGLEFAAAEREYIIACKIDNKLDELFRMLFIKQCNALNALLPELFERIGDYTELLLNILYTDQDGVVWHLINDIKEKEFLIRTEDHEEAIVKGEITEEDAPSGQVEIIGWMYQYYNTELNEVVYDGNLSKSRIPKELLPAATTIYTPDWAIRYMVENSLGRLWLEGHPSDALKANWKYYLDETEQSPEVQARLEQIRVEYRGLSPEEITFIDPCMGSGHILAYAFDVFMQIYESAGYSQRDAARLIIEKNIYGIDIDKRAYQLAYFALFMKARQYNRRIMDLGVQVNLCEIKESNSIGGAYKHEMGNFLLEKRHQLSLNYLMDAFRDAKEYGSILQLEPYDYNGLMDAWKYISSLTTENFSLTLWYAAVQESVPPLIKQACILSKRYHVVCTNPPYLGSSRFSAKLNDYIVSKYADVKSDLSMVMYKHALADLSKANGFVAFITTSSWMFLSRFEKLRNYMLPNYDMDSLVDFGTELFEGKVGHNTIVAWVNRIARTHKSMTAVRLVDYCYSRRDEKEPEFFSPKNRYNTTADNFAKIPGSPVAYWVADRMYNNFSAPTLSSFATVTNGMFTCDNNRFLRMWYEVKDNEIFFTCLSKQQSIDSSKKWYPYNKGGDFRRWYGNHYNVVNFRNFGGEISQYRVESGQSASFPGQNYYFSESLSWSFVSSSKFGIRYYPNGFVFDIAGSSVFPNDKNLMLYLLGLLASEVSFYVLGLYNPTINFQAGDIKKIPLIIDKGNIIHITNRVMENISISQYDWDSFETSWDFKEHPLTKWQKYGATHHPDQNTNLISRCFTLWSVDTKEHFYTLKRNEEELNRIFIDIYGLQDELTPDVADKDVTVTLIYNNKEDIPESMKGNGFVLTRAGVIKSFISYAVGCMFGRYSLDVEGLAYAGGEWDAGKYGSFISDRDNIIPITDEEYLPDDIVARFAEFVRTVYGAGTLEENLCFIADALGGKGSTAREVIRNYFLRDFFKDHVKTYKKRPIYWLFDSGKADGFKALIYLHRYDQDTVGKLRVDYLHKLQRVYESEIARMRETIEKSSDAREVSAAQKRLEKLTKQLKEAKEYDEKIAHLALARIALDLDDGVKVNYEKLQTGTDGKKYEVLGKI